MLEGIVNFLGSLDPALIYLVLFFFSFIENIFPPSPSDIVLIIGSALVTNSTLGFVPILLITSFGSTIGFAVMYYAGEFMGEKLLRSGRIKFITQESLAKADKFFGRYGYKVIVINRFLPGTRAIVSFFTGVHRLNPGKTFLFAFMSSFLWNAFLISLGILLGKNIVLIDSWLSEYSRWALVITVIIVIFLTVRFLIKRKKNEIPR